MDLTNPSPLFFVVIMVYDDSQSSTTSTSSTNERLDMEITEAEGSLLKDESDCKDGLGPLGPENVYVSKKLKPSDLSKDTAADCDIEHPTYFNLCEGVSLSLDKYPSLTDLSRQANYQDQTRRPGAYFVTTNRRNFPSIEEVDDANTTSNTNEQYSQHNNVNNAILNNGILTYPYPVVADLVEEPICNREQDEHQRNSTMILVKAEVVDPYNNLKSDDSSRSRDKTVLSKFQKRTLVLLYVILIIVTAIATIALVRRRHNRKQLRRGNGEENPYHKQNSTPLDDWPLKPQYPKGTGPFDSPPPNSTWWNDCMEQRKDRNYQNSARPDDLQSPCPDSTERDYMEQRPESDDYDVDEPH
jgi:hypothetical protein